MLGGVVTPGENRIEITVVYDNNDYDSSLTPDWGFSCHIAGLEKSILFDTGRMGPILLSNLEKLGLGIESIDAVFLSHLHRDHAGGLDDLLSRHGKLKVFVPRSFPDHMKENIGASGSSVVEVGDSTQLCPNAYSTGEDGETVIEQSLVVKTPSGLLVITGCAHPGIVRVVKTSKALFGGGVRLVLGGLHLFERSREEIGGIIDEFRELGVERVAPSHCTGELALGLFESSYGENFTKIGVGARITLE